MSQEQVADDHLHGLVDGFLGSHIGGIGRDVGHALGIAVHSGRTGEEAHQFEVKESTKSVSLAAIDMIVGAGEEIGISLFEVLNENVGIGNTRVGALPDVFDGFLACKLRVIELVGIAPLAVAVDVVAVGEHLYEADTHVQTVHVL